MIPQYLKSVDKIKHWNALRNGILITVLGLTNLPSMFVLISRNVTYAEIYRQYQMQHFKSDFDFFRLLV